MDIISLSKDPIQILALWSAIFAELALQSDQTTSIVLRPFDIFLLDIF